MYNNGILIQATNEPTAIVKNFIYSGINAFWNFPLTWVNDLESRRLTKEQQSKEIEPSIFMNLEFISNEDLYKRYIVKCKSLGLECRVLFIQSMYEQETWVGEIPNMEFLGYEYCPIPIDDQIITDLDWYKPFREHIVKLNEHGLFKTYDDANNFSLDYNIAFNNGKIGDGEANNYICKVFKVILD